MNAVDYWIEHWGQDRQWKAIKQGWAIVRDHDITGPLAIHRSLHGLIIGEAFGSNQDAELFVAMRAAAGDELAKHALEIINKWNEGDTK